MNIEKLKKGMAIKNYKSLCEVLEIEVKTSTNSKKAQLKELKRYVEFHKEGQTFVIDDIYNKVKEKIDKRGGNNKIYYTSYIEKLILDLLVQNYNKESICLSKNKLFKEFKMVNINYSFCKERIIKLSKFIGIQQETINEWYDSSNNTLIINLETSLNNLTNQSLIFWSNEISVCKININAYGNKFNIQKQTKMDEYNEETSTYKINPYYSFEFRQSTSDERKFILDTETQIMQQLSIENKILFENKTDIIAFGLWNIYRKRVNQILLEKYNIDYYYNSYKISFNQTSILEKEEYFIDDLLLSKEEREETQILLNKAISNRLNNNAEKRKDRALEDIRNGVDLIKEKKLKRRIEVNYIKDNFNLTDILINNNSKNIHNEIKRIKIK